MHDTTSPLGSTIYQGQVKNINKYWGTTTKTVGPLTDPLASGARAEDAFNLVLPSMPGYGFSEKPQGTGWGPERIARAWDVLMKRLGYTRYVSQGDDWGSVVSDVMARQAPPGLLGIHVNMPATVPPDIAKALSSGEPAPAGLSPEEQAAYEQMGCSVHKGLRLCPHDGDPPANPGLQPGGFAWSASCRGSTTSLPIARIAAGSPSGR